MGGLRDKPGLDNKPIFIRQTSSKFIDATQSGDIIGVNGHVVAIDKIGR